MIIKRIIIKGLYGFINKDIKFKKDLNIIVGINGSGKTSVLQIINWLTMPDLPSLCTTQFDSLTLYLTNDGNDIEVHASQESNRTLTLQITCSDTKMSSINYELLRETNYFTEHPNSRDEYYDRYTRFTPNTEEVQTIRFLEALNTPIFLDIFRSVVGSRDSNSTLQLATSPRKDSSNKQRNPLRKIKELTGQAYYKYKSEVGRFDLEVYKDFFDSAFSTISLEEATHLINQYVSSEANLNSKEANLISYFSKSTLMGETTKDTIKKIKDLFKWMRELQPASNPSQQRNPHQTTAILNISIFKRIDIVLKKFQDREEKIEKAYEPIKKYLDTINHFFIDSAKQFSFNEGEGALSYKLLDKKGNTIRDNVSLASLSSGERQILILFTSIAFADTSEQVFIIDEPELSLHPKWLEDFLEKFLYLRQPSTQLIFASHSPSIVGNFENKCIILLPYNK
jgi:predicted ATP-dependent endonuclease of OLD family